MTRQAGNEKRQAKVKQTLPGLWWRPRWHSSAQLKLRTSAETGSPALAMHSLTMELHHRPNMEYHFQQVAENRPCDSQSKINK